MRRTASSLVLVSALVASAWEPLAACGDKLLLVGRGLRFQRAYASIHPGHVLVYARASMTGRSAIRDPQLHRALRQAGHSVTVTADAAALEQSLRLTRVDVVLADVNDRDRVNALVAAVALPPDLLYVAYPSAAGDTQAAPAPICKLKPSDRAMKYLDVVEDAMTGRAAARRASAEPSEQRR